MSKFLASSVYQEVLLPDSTTY